MVYQDEEAQSPLKPARRPHRHTPTICHNNCCDCIYESYGNMKEDNKLSCVWSGERGGGLNIPSLQVTYNFFNWKKNVLIWRVSYL